MTRKFDPLSADHPLVRDNARTCPGCSRAFLPGDVTTLVTIGPGDDEDARARRDEGRPYNAIALPVHWDCSDHE